MPLSRGHGSVLLMLLLAGASAACQPPTAGRSGRDQMLGAWDLRSRTVRGGGGEVVADPILGTQPIGRLFYDASGRMGLQMMRPGRDRAIGVPDDAEQAANARIVLGYDSYFGTFHVDEAAGTVTHHVEGSLFPEDLGKDFTRRFRVEGDTFELSFTSPAADGSSVTRTLVFERGRPDSR